MNFLQKLIFLALVAAIMLPACKSDSNANATATDPNAPKQIMVEAEPQLSSEGATAMAVTDGTIFWQGKKSMGGAHFGQIRVSGGELLVKEGRLIGGNATIDMNSLSVSDIKDPSEKADLESHLKDNDFFEVNKFPTGEFKITELLPSQLPDFNYVINGELTLKGKTNDVNIPVKLKIDGNSLTAQSASFVINRTQWGINYSSGIVGTVKDKAIDDTVILSLTINAKAK